MRKTLAVIMIVGLVSLSMFAWSATAFAQVTGTCNGPGAMPATITVDPQSGPAGSVTTLTGTINVQPTVDNPGNSGATEATVQQVQSVQAWWLETGLGDAVFVGDLPIVAEPNLIRFGGNITIPASASAGPHEIAVIGPGDEDPACVAFTVTQSVGQTAYQQVAAVLPATGESILVPVMGLLAAGAGVLLFLFRRSRVA